MLTERSVLTSHINFCCRSKADAGGLDLSRLIRLYFSVVFFLQLSLFETEALNETKNTHEYYLKARAGPQNIPVNVTLSYLFFIPQIQHQTEQPLSSLSACILVESLEGGSLGDQWSFL